MAKKTITLTEYTDDLTGGKADGTITFSFDGIAYEIDLSKANARAFAKDLKPYVDAARRVRSPRSGASTRRTSKRDDSGAIRAWAATNGLQVSSRGRIAQSVLQAYESGH